VSSARTVSMSVQTVGLQGVPIATHQSRLVSSVVRLSVTSVALSALSVVGQSVTTTPTPVPRQTNQSAWPVAKTVRAVARSTVIHDFTGVELILTCTVRPIPAPVRPVQTRCVTVISGPALPVGSTFVLMTASRVRRVGIRAVLTMLLPVTDAVGITVQRPSARVKFVRISSVGAIFRRVPPVSGVSVEKIPLRVQSVTRRPVWITRPTAQPPASHSVQSIIHPARSVPMSSPIRTS
jgi:hypothetical protein